MPHDHLHSTHQVLTNLRLGLAVDRELIEQIADDLTEAQFGALFAGLSVPKHCVEEKGIRFGNKAEWLKSLAAARDKGANYCYAVVEKYSSPDSDWDEFCRKIVSCEISDLEAGAWLMSVAIAGIDRVSTMKLTRAMADSGQLFDYRSTEPKGQFLRRYPTGALSEKIALMMPVVLLDLRNLLNLQLFSPFLIARVLSHTGGTRDKLAAIKGFEIPQPGESTERILKRIGVAYTATSDEFNPADNRLYSLRSETSTVESTPLIVSSIASKMLACPADVVQIDARWGTGAFFDTVTAAKDCVGLICETMIQEGIDTFFTVTEANHPTGSGIGAAAEVAEAVVGLGGGTYNFDPRGIYQQRFLVADFASRLVAEQFNLDKFDLFRLIMSRFDDGSYRKSFITLLTEHSVSKDHAETLWERPDSLFDRFTVQEVHAKNAGRLSAINQFEIGHFLKGNFLDASVTIDVRPGDFVKQGQVLARVFTTSPGDLPDFNSEWFFLSKHEVA